MAKFKEDREENRVTVTFLIVVAFVASILYCPHHIKYSEGGGSISFGNGIGNKSPIIEIDRVQYTWIWDAPEHSSLEFGRLAVTWLGIAVVGGALLFYNQDPRKPPSQ